jgi:CheY-like chemotaxis protein
MDEIRIFEEDISNDVFKKAGHFLRVEISDTGCGMTLETREKIFEPFFTTKEVGKGTGLGLSTVLGIVEEMGGFVTVYSDIGAGSCFKLYFPIQNAEVLPEEVHNPTEEDLAIEESDFKIDQNIMIVANEENIRKMLTRTLIQLGFQVSTFPSATAAIHAFSQSPGTFELVITDQSMPEMTGIKLAKEITSISAETPVVLATGNAAAIADSDIEDAHLACLLSKPIQLSELKKCVKEILIRH